MIINQIQIEHILNIYIPDTYSNYLLENVENLICTSCGVALTIKHVLTQCLQLEKLR